MFDRRDSAPSYDEGVIKFDAQHTSSSLELEALGEAGAELLRWRQDLYAAQLIGQDPRRYGGAGYGNASARLPRGAFVITGTQTGGVAGLGPEGLCVVTDVHLSRNAVVSHGPARPSSESMTHAMIYDGDPRARFVFHAHDPGIWGAALEGRLQLHVTDPKIAYGTPEMGRAILRALRDDRVRAEGVLVMGGHEDGVISFGRDAQSAAQALLRAQAAA